MAGADAYWRPPRSCEDYWSEFRHCTSLWNRFHHYYAQGTSPSCQQWREDYNTCRQWEKSSSAESQVLLQRSERAREAKRRTTASVWELRQNPPPDWHLPLPQDKPQDS